MKNFILSLFLIISVTTVLTAQTDMNYIVKEECLCASSDDNFKKLNKISARKDKAALMEMVNNNEVFILEKNARVVLVNGGIGKSTVKVTSGKLKGRTVVLSSEFIKKL